jgi:hypothetical protein
MSGPLSYRDWLRTAHLRFPELLRLHSPETAQHVVQFYDDDSFVIRNVADLTAKALDAGSSVVAIATQSHLEQLSEHLGAERDLEGYRDLGRFVTMDAVAALSKLMVNNHPDEPAFDRIMGSIMRNAAAKSTNGFVFTFGEMVALLCAANNSSDALRLEQFWNRLADHQRFSLYCAYPIRSLEKEPIDNLVGICTQHALTVPA